MAVLEKFFAAEADYITSGGPGKASFAGMAACLHPDVVIHQAEGLPYGGTWRGHDGFERWMGEMSKAWSALEFQERRYAVDGVTAVVLNRGVLVARETGTPLATWVMQWMDVRDGLMHEIRPFYWDTAAVREALGLDVRATS